MTARHLRDGLWALTAIISFATLLAWRMHAPEARTATQPITSGEKEQRHTSADSLRRSASYVAAHDPFRAEHHPSIVPYSPELESAAASAPPPPPKPPKPRLAVSGIVGGPPWSALLDSVPGRDGSVLVSKGDTLGGLKISFVGRDTVIVQGADTVWRLVVKRPWQ
jgi:hypothetical protein